MTAQNITIIGAGAWGSALATVCIAHGHPTLLWHRPEDAPYNPDLPTTTSLEEALSHSALSIIAVAARAVISVALLMDPLVRQLEERGTISFPRWLIASKGLCPQGYTMAAALETICPNIPVGALGGPNIASEIAHLQACGLTMALPSSWPQSKTEQDRDILRDPLRVEVISDVLGLQLWSALKNLMAIGYGLVQQATSSENMWATYLTLAFQEIQNIVIASGGKSCTAMCFGALGDLILTSHSPKGRNSAFGRHFPHPPETLVEGLDTLTGAKSLVQRLGVHCPLIYGIDQVLHREITPKDWVRRICQPDIRDHEEGRRSHL